MYTAYPWSSAQCTGTKAPGTSTGPSASNGSPVHSRHCASEPLTVIDTVATESTVPPARAWTRSQGSSGSPSSGRVSRAYSSIGSAGRRCLPLGRTGATTSP